MTEPIGAVGFADVNGARLYYEAVGNGHPLALIHAGIADCRMWDGQMATFARRYRVIRFDPRGFGRSSNADGMFAHRDDLFVLLGFLDVRSAYVLGISMGGQIAIEFALEHPEIVDALIRVNSGVGERPPSPFVDRGWTEADEALEAGDLERAVEVEQRLWVDGPHRTPNQVEQGVRQRVRTMNAALLARQADDRGEPQKLDPPAIDRLGEIGVPTLIVVGDQDVDDVLTMADILAAGIGGARKVVIPDADHMVSMERPNEFNRVVLDFLAQIEPGART